MNASELRIGNYVSSPLSSALHGLWQIRDGQSIMDVDIHERMYEPIPLTEEWLIKLGFELKRIDEDDTFERYQLPIPKTSWYLANVFTYGSVTLFNNRDHTSTGVGAQYVHQLQNLYFTLTGTELTIKE